MKKLYIVLVTALLAAVLLVSLWPYRDATTNTYDAPHAEQVESASAPVVRALDRAPHQVAARTPAPVAAKPPVFDEVWLEKSEICRGENNAVHVRAHAEDGNGSDTFLRISTVHPETGKTLRGSHMPFQMETAGEHELVISLMSIGGVHAVSLPLRVKDCDAKLSLALQVERTFNEPDVVRFKAVLRESTQASQLKPPISYHWDFGDGTSEDTQSPEVVHSYEGRSQDSVQSAFVAQVTLKSGAVEAVSAARSVSFENLAVAMLHALDRLSISVGVKPATGNQGEQIRLYHGYKESVRIERLRVRETVLDDPGKPEREVFAREYEPAQLLGFSELPPRTSVVLPDLTYLQPEQAGAVRYVELTGHTEDGKLASATFTLLPPKTTRSQANP